MTIPATDPPLPPSAIEKAASQLDLSVEEIERELLDFLHTGSERGFQIYRLVLDYVMDARRKPVPGLATLAIRGASRQHYAPVVATANDLLKIEEADEDLTAWARGYTHAHAWRISCDVEMAHLICERLAPQAPKSLKILEVGSSPYLFTAHMKREGFDITGLDLDPTRQPNLIAAEGLDILAHDIEGDDPYTELQEKFDVIEFNEVFEHLRINPLNVLRKLHSWLKPNGQLILSTPNVQSYMAFKTYVDQGAIFSVGAVPFLEYSKLEKIGHMGHVREYTAIEVVHTLQRLGFAPHTLAYRFSPTLLSLIQLPHVHARWGGDMIIVSRKAEVPLPPDHPPKD